MTDHPPYSLNLAFSDFFLFPNLKKCLSGQCQNEKVITHTNTYFEDLPQCNFSEGLEKVEERLTKCIKLQGDYVEK